MRVLNQYGIQYDYNTRYKVKSSRGAWLRWDIHICHNGKHYFIECNGQQHYLYNPQFHGDIKNGLFERQKVNDQIKVKFCHDNGWPFLEISYKDFFKTEQIVLNFLVDNGM